MTAINFPDSPTLGQTFSPGTGATYQWNGTYWAVSNGNVVGLGLPVVGEVVTSGSPSSITISLIPSYYRDLQIRVSGQSTAAVASEGVYVRFNGDTGSNYRYIVGLANNTGGFGIGSQSASATSMQIGFIPGASSGVANDLGGAVVDVKNYAGSFYKSVSGDGVVRNGDSGGVYYASMNAGWWNSTAVVNSITVFPATGNWKDGSVITVYGIGGIASYASPPATTDYFSAPSIVKTVPANGSFTAQNSTNSTVGLTYYSDRAVMTTTASTSGYQTGFATVPYPGADFTMIAQVMLHTTAWNNNTQRWGLAVQDTTNKTIIEGFGDFANATNAGGATEFIPTSLTNLNSGFTTLANSWWQGWPFSGTPVWLKLVQSSGNFLFYYSQDGVNWIGLDSRATSSLGTVTKIGVLYINTTANQLNTTMSIFSFKVTTP